MGFLTDVSPWPWCVGVTDLRVISEIIDSPSEFLLYLERRSQSHNEKALFAHDELDYFIWFLQTGLYIAPAFSENRINTTRFG